MTEPIVIHIQPVETENLVSYLVYLGPNLLVTGGPTPLPYYDAALELIALGYDPQRKLIMRRRGVNVNQLSYKLRDAAYLGPIENQANPPFQYPLQQDGPGAVR